MKLVHLVGFIIKKFVTMHGHMKVKFTTVFTAASENNTTLKKLTSTVKMRKRVDPWEQD